MHNKPTINCMVEGSGKNCTHVRGSPTLLPVGSHEEVKFEERKNQNEWAGGQHGRDASGISPHRASLRARKQAELVSRGPHKSHVSMLWLIRAALLPPFTVMAAVQSPLMCYCADALCQGQSVYGCTSCQFKNLPKFFFFKFKIKKYHQRFSRTDELQQLFCEAWGSFIL